MIGTLDVGGPGFFGKLPKHGDFVTRRLPSEFVDVWDGWLQQVIADTREQLGEAWLEAYLVCPIWRFVLAPGVCGKLGWLGALMASVDRVGRYFPLTVALPLPESATGFATLLLSHRVSREWFEPVEDAMLGVLGALGADAEELAEALTAANASGLFLLVSEVAALAVREDPVLQAQRWSWPAAATDQLADLVLRARLRKLDKSFAPLTAWSSSGSETRAGEFYALRGLPSSRVFSALLIGEAGGLAEAAQGVNSVTPPSGQSPRSDETVPRASTFPSRTLEDDGRTESDRLLGE